MLAPFMTHDDFWWMGMIRRDVNNWTPWIVSNVIETALLCERDAVRRAEIVARGMRMLDSYLAVLPEDGGCDEGVGYFNMAGASLFDCLELLYAASAGRIDFYGERTVRAIGEYPARMHVKGDLFLNFADCDARPALDGDRLYLYGLRTGNARIASLGAMLHARRMQDPANLEPRDVPQASRVLFALFADVKPLAPVTPPPYEAMEHLQVYIWRQKRLMVAFKGGHNGEGHNHNDLGSVVAYLDGEPCVVDMGNRVYTARTFGPERYTLDNTRSMNHNVRKAATNGENRVIYHCHATNVIALTYVLPLTDRDFSRALWQSATECPVVFPEGVGVCPWMAPGGADIAMATSELMKTYQAAVWAQHGLFASGPDFDTAFGLAHTIEKSAEICWKVLATGRPVRQTITDDALRAIARDFGVTLNEAFLD